jgi:hypothetical protein
VTPPLGEPPFLASRTASRARSSVAKGFALVPAPASFPVVETQNSCPRAALPASIASDSRHAAVRRPFIFRERKHMTFLSETVSRPRYLLPSSFVLAAPFRKSTMPETGRIVTVGPTRLL